jgi:hypothetical protein
MTHIFTSGDKLVGDVKFAAADTYEFADTVYRLIQDGFINAGSVGFRALEWKFSTDPGRPMGIDFKRVELLEFSICPIPANANALVEGKLLRSRRAASGDPVAELAGLVGRMARAARLRRALPAAAPEPQWRRVERARDLAQRMRDWD